LSNGEVQRRPETKRKGIKGRNNDGNVADFFGGCAVDSHLVIREGGVTPHCDAVGGLCVIRYGGGDAARRGQGNFQGPQLSIGIFNTQRPLLVGG